MLCNRGIQYIDRDRGTLVDVQNVHLRVDIEETHLDRRRPIDIIFLSYLLDLTSERMRKLAVDDRASEFGVPEYTSIRV